MPTLSEGVSVSDDQRDEVQPLPKAHTLRLGDLPAYGDDGGTGPDDPATPDVVEELRLRLRELAKKNLYFLCKAVLMYGDLTMHTHWEYAKFISDLSNRKTLDLMPRGIFKTTIGTIGFAIWLLINDPNLFILICNQTAGNAETMLEEIEAHLDGSNPIFAWLFPEYIKPNAKWKPWSSSRMTVPCRDIISGTASITIIGVGGKPESKHHHVIIKDDLIGRKAMISHLEMMEAITWNDYTDSLFVDASKGIERMHGTRWSLSDLYHGVMKSGTHAVFIRKAILDDGSLFFPERLTHEVLREIRDRNFLAFMSQYQNDPSSPENLDFRKEWLNMYLMGRVSESGELYCELAGRKFWVKDMEVGLLIDSAASGDVEMDIAAAMKRGRAEKANNALMILGTHPSGYWFILDLWTGRGHGRNPELQIAEKMIEMALRWQGYVYRGFLEAFGAEGGLLTVYDLLRRERQCSLVIEKLPRGQVRAKKVRIRTNVGGIAESGMLCARSIHDTFLMEFCDFPQSNTFDTLDCLSWGIEHIRKPQSEVEMQDHKIKSARHKSRRRIHIGPSGY